MSTSTRTHQLHLTGVDSRVRLLSLIHIPPAAKSYRARAFVQVLDPRSPSTRARGSFAKLCIVRATPYLHLVPHTPRTIDIATSTGNTLVLAGRARGLDALFLHSPEISPSAPSGLRFDAAYRCTCQSSAARRLRRPYARPRIVPLRKRTCNKNVHATSTKILTSYSYRLRGIVVAVVRQGYEDPL